ncbi:NCS1 nucleoside transporter family [Geodermatophilus bullaregiensis]|uniref:purine-cytosine permease family protein n=1 Tax=Geodermatophilus bullaregiensis TaxID=1564160 RepID=UPI00195ADFD2|nr:cytosine permease [Geodermatophilus bullaregiensis]MBM7805231.1 NCS1 nucleoside transporter family [Geodermatophilus bullaregiensis]
MSETARRPERTRIEVRSIDYVPRAERHGKVWHQGPFWFAGNFVLVTMVTGFIGVSLGLSLGWTLLAIVLGVGFGTFFMAFHANQGPRMGLPQMIQSRAQFGSRGAVLPFAATVFVYVGFIVFDLILATQALQLVLPGGPWFWYPALALLSIAIAVVGHDLLHFVQRWLTYVLLAFFGVFTVWAIVHLGDAAQPVQTGWSLTGFLTMFSVAAGYQISYSVYVSDYSRYLPADTPAGKVIAWTYLGAGGSAIWLMGLGALLADRLEAPDAIGSLVTVGNELFPHFGTALVLVSVPALIGIMSVNAYGAMLTSASAVDGFRRISPGVRTRITGIVVVMILSVVIALVLPEDYLGSFNTFVLLMLYFLIPWTAVNLVDFYFVRRGRYAITEIFRPRGIYGTWPARGLVPYLAGVLAMVPFVVTTAYTGPVAEALGGVDVSFLVGLVVAGGLYLVLSRSLDTAAEERARVRSDEELESLVRQGRTHSPDGFEPLA